MCPCCGRGEKAWQWMNAGVARSANKTATVAGCCAMTHPTAGLGLSIDTTTSTSSTTTPSTGALAAIAVHFIIPYPYAYIWRFNFAKSFYKFSNSIMSFHTFFSTWRSIFLLQNFLPPNSITNFTALLNRSISAGCSIRWMSCFEQTGNPVFPWFNYLDIFGQT